MEPTKIKDIVKSAKDRRAKGRTETGKPKNVVDTTPMLEAAGRSAVVTFGRLNPPTTGHEKMVNAMKKAAGPSNADVIVYLSQATDSSKNPLKPDVKAQLVAKAFGVKAVVAKDPVAMLKDLNGKYDNLVVVVGGDRFEKFEWIKKHNGGKDWSFKNLQLHNAGLRDPDADDVSGMSASKLRALAKSNDLEAFKRGLPAGIRGDAAKLMRIINEHVMLEELEEAELSLNEGLTLSQRVRRSQIMRRLKTRLAIGQKRARAKHADESHLMKRAKRAAKNFLRKRVLRDKNYAELTYSARAAVDARIKAKAAAINKLAKRLLPRIRKAELNRHLGGAWGSISAAKGGKQVHEQAIGGEHDRSKLPQIRDMQSALVHLNTETALTRIQVDALNPTQTHIDDRKVEGIVKTYRAGTLAALRPIVISSDNQIVDGHHRWAAAKMIGLAQMPALRVLMPFEGIVQKLASSDAVEYRRLGESVDASTLRRVVDALL